MDAFSTSLSFFFFIDICPEQSHDLWLQIGGLVSIEIYNSLTQKTRGHVQRFLTWSEGNKSVTLVQLITVLTKLLGWQDFIPSKNKCPLLELNAIIIDQRHCHKQPRINFLTGSAVLTTSENNEPIIILRLKATPIITQWFAPDWIYLGFPTWIWRMCFSWYQKINVDLMSVGGGMKCGHRDLGLTWSCRCSVGNNNSFVFHFSVAAFLFLHILPF